MVGLRIGFAKRPVQGGVSMTRNLRLCRREHQTLCRPGHLPMMAWITQQLRKSQGCNEVPDWRESLACSFVSAPGAVSAGSRCRTEWVSIAMKRSAVKGGLGRGDRRCSDPTRRWNIVAAASDSRSINDSSRWHLPAATASSCRSEAIPVNRRHAHYY